MRSFRRRLTAAIAAGGVLGASLVLARATATPTSASSPPASSARLSVPGGGGSMKAGTETAGTATPALATAAPAGYPVTGIDVASYQGNVNWASVRAAGRHFAYVKATEGTTYRNPYFAQQYGGAKAAGLYAGAYVFARPDADDPVQQARFFLANAAFARDGKTLPLMLDLEGPYGQPGLNQCWNRSPASMVAWIRAFVTTVQGATAQPMLIYTNPNWWNPCTGNSAAFGGQLLNIPYWHSTPPKILPAGWSKWTFWQYADAGALPGDQDVFSGNLNQLALLAKPGLAPGTSPSIAALRGGGYEIAYQAVTGSLVTIGAGGYRVWGLGLRPGTSPSIAGLKNGGYQVAFQANTGGLWTVGSAGNRSWGLGLRAGTSPGIASLATGGFQVAFQANSSYLWSVGTAGLQTWRLGLKAGTSPGIARLPGGGFQMAFQANSGYLWTVGTAGLRSWQLGVMAGTTPSIIGLTSGGYQIAFQAQSGLLWAAGSAGLRSWSLGLKRGTGPDIASIGGRYMMAVQVNVGVLWTAAG